LKEGRRRPAPAGKATGFTARFTGSQLIPPKKPGKRRSDGNTTVRISQALVPKLPHERDESPAAGKKASEPVIEKAADDLKQGHKDTDRGPETNRIARKLTSGN